MRQCPQRDSARHIVARASADEEDGDHSCLQLVKVQVYSQQVSSESGQVRADRCFKLPESLETLPCKFLPGSKRG